MPAKSFLGSLEADARRFYATVIRQEVPDANVRGYLRAATQIAEVWQQIDDQVTASIAAGRLPWDAYAEHRSALAYIRIARAYQVFVEQLLAADAAADPATAGYLPRVTYDQADALCHQIQPPLQAAVAALSDPTYHPDSDLPATMGPRIDSENGPCPVAHLEGMISATREIREWAAGLLAQYEQAVTHATTPTPPAIQAHLTTLHRRLAEADTQLRFGVDLVGQVTQGEATADLHEEAEDNLWSALQALFFLNQVIASPEWLAKRPATPLRRMRWPLPSLVVRQS